VAGFAGLRARRSLLFTLFACGSSWPALPAYGLAREWLSQLFACGSSPGWRHGFRAGDYDVAGQRRRAPELEGRTLVVVVFEFEEAALIARRDEHHLRQGQLALNVDGVEGARPSRAWRSRGVIGRCGPLCDRSRPRRGPGRPGRRGMRGRRGPEGDQQCSGKSRDIISLQQQIAGDLAEKLRSKLSTSERQRVTKQGTQNPEAYELELKGRYSWNRRTPADLKTAIFYFNQAIAKDPGYALAYSGLADVYSVLPDYGGTPSEDYPKSNVSARKALELDATLAHPHAVLGTNEMAYDWDFEGGEAESRRLSNSTPTMPRHTNGTQNNLPQLGAGNRRPLLKSIALTNSIRCHRSSAGRWEPFTTWPGSTTRP